MEENEQINEHLKNSLHGFLVHPKISSYEEILRKMQKKKRRRFLFFLFPGLLILSSAVLMLNLNLNKENSIAVIKEKQNEARITDHKQKELSNISKSNTNFNSKKIVRNRGEKSSPEKDPVAENAGTAAQISKDKPQDTNEQEKQPASIDALRTTEQVRMNEQNFKEELKKIPDSMHTSDQVLITIENADRLETVFRFLPLNNRDEDVRIDSIIANEINRGLNDSLKKKKNRHFFLGLSFNPQAGSYYFQKNKNTWYDKTSVDKYYDSKTGENSVSFNYAFGIKAGMTLKEKWEIMLGIGFQKYTQLEKINTIVLSPALANPRYNSFLGVDPTFGDVPAQVGHTYKNEFKYWDYCLELNRFVTLKNRLKAKFGLGLHLQRRAYFLSKGSQVIVVGDNSGFYLSDAYINHWQIGPNLNTMHLKAGLIEDLNKTIQVQFCPMLQYSLNSMYAKNYLIKQKSITFGLECLLLFKIR